MAGDSVERSKQKIERRAEARMRQQAENLLALNLFEARLQRPDLFHRDGEAARNRHALTLFGYDMHAQHATMLRWRLYPGSSTCAPDRAPRPTTVRRTGMPASPICRH
jgi:hypothetical protein